MKRALSYVAVATMAMALGAAIQGCGVEAGPYTNDRMLESSDLHVISSFKYGKDKYGNCFAIYNAGLQTGLMTAVDCAKVGM